MVPVKDLIDVLIEFDRLFLYKNHLKFDSIKINNIWTSSPTELNINDNGGNIFIVLTDRSLGFLKWNISNI